MSEAERGEADQIEREIHKRFSEQVYVGMGIQDYHAALTHVVVRYAAERLSRATGQDAKDNERG